LWCISGWLVQFSQDFIFHAVRSRRWQEPIDGISLAVYKELGEIPGDFAPSDPGHGTGLLLLEEFPQRMSVIAIDIDLGKEVECDPVFGQNAGLDLRVRAGLLSSELIAGESGDSQPLVFILSVQCLQLVIVGVGQPSVGRYVEDDHHFASVLAEADAIAIDGVGFVVINCCPFGRRQEGSENEKGCFHDRVFRRE